MIFLAVFLFLSDYLFCQNLFLFYANASVKKNYSISDVINDKNLDINFYVDNERKFNFEDLLIDNVTEKDVKEVEEDDEGFIEIPYSIEEPEPVNYGGDGKITIKRKDTGEKQTFYYRNKDGSYNENELLKIQYIMRCSLGNEEIKIPKKLIEILDAIEDKFSKNKGITLLSGYRTKELNDITPGAAKNSYHLIGWAADIKIEGVSTRKIRDFARKLKAGGVGYYPKLGFVHIDIGKVRYWEKYQYSRKKNIYARKKKKINSVNSVKNLNNRSHNKKISTPLLGKSSKS